MLVLRIVGRVRWECFYYISPFVCIAWFSFLRSTLQSASPCVNWYSYFSFPMDVKIQCLPWDVFAWFSYGVADPFPPRNPHRYNQIRSISIILTKNIYFFDFHLHNLRNSYTISLHSSKKPVSRKINAVGEFLDEIQIFLLKYKPSKQISCLWWVNPTNNYSPIFLNSYFSSWFWWSLFPKPFSLYSLRHLLLLPTTP